MLYIIGLGLNQEGISLEGKDMLSRCKRVYLEHYTVDFPYSVQELADKIGVKKIHIADRDKVENLSLVDEAKKLNVALLVYGSPLVATTHSTLMEECHASGVKVKILHAGSVFDSVLSTGLQFYKFGKVASMPAWKKSFTPTSFMQVVKDNRSIDAHSLILIDIGLPISEALVQLSEAADKEEVTLDQIIICQALGTKHQKILVRHFSEAQELTSVRHPYCIILPGKLHHMEKALLESQGR